MKMTTVDYDKLLLVLENNNIDIHDLCEEVGYARGYSSHIRSTSKMPVHMINALETKHNIKVASYLPMETKVIEKVVEQQASIDMEQLYKVIYGAVYEAVKKALSE